MPLNDRTPAFTAPWTLPLSMATVVGASAAQTVAGRAAAADVAAITRVMGSRRLGIGGPPEARLSDGRVQADCRSAAGNDKA